MSGSIETERLTIRPPEERDRDRFVELFASAGFMVYSLSGALDLEGAHRRFDRMLVVAGELPFCKQPVVERATGTLIGYAGADFVDWRGERRIEWGYRLVEEARGKGYATEASRALLDLAGDTYTGEILGLIDPTNEPSRNVLSKLGFTFLCHDEFDGFPTEIHRIAVGDRAS